MSICVQKLCREATDTDGPWPTDCSAPARITYLRIAPLYLAHSLGRRRFRDLLKVVLTHDVSRFQEHVIGRR
jgi:hypothetical protein